MEFVNMGHNSEKHEHAEEEGAAHVRHGYGHITEQDPLHNTAQEKINKSRKTSILLSMFSTSYREKTVQLAGHEVKCSVLDFADKQILCLSRDGELDVTYDLQTRPLAVEGSRTQVPTVLIGGNLKTQVLASQIGQHISKNTILNVSGKLFAGSEPADQDHELLVELVALVKAVLQSQPA
ncbi:hypothetical protein KL944_002539 [Ogataea haglerorum]|nr:hypothetical protein KL944_002539 [Ogataea haglerorum]